MAPANKEQQHDIETGESNSSIDNDSRRASKSITKHMKKIMFRAKKKKTSEEAELSPLIDNNDLQTSGTFDSDVLSNEDHHYEHPRSQARMAKKWGKLKDRIHTPTASLPWMMDQVFGSFRLEDPTQRASRIKEAQEKIRTSMEFSLWHCLLAIGLYVAGTVYCFSFWLEPDWTVVDSVYFAVVTFTTIGYGDVVPDTRAARIFTCVWALSGVACLGIALGVLGSSMLEVAEQEQQKTSSMQQSEVFDMFNIDSVPHHVRSGDDSTTVSQWSDLGSLDAREHALPGWLPQEEEQDMEPSERRTCLDYSKTQRFFWISAFMVVILFFMSQTEGWNVWTTIYYGLITAATVGYGDFAPLTQTGRILAVIYIPVGVCVIGSLLDIIANSIIDYRKNRGQQTWRNKDLTLEDLRVMDGDGDGTVTKAEFLEFMLVAMNQVDQELLDNLKAHFERLDQDNNGCLNKDDLINVAHYNVKKEKSLKRLRF